jgi:hypothetical protein
MGDPVTERRYPGFAQVEYEHVRRHFFPRFEWVVFDAPPPRNPLAVPLERARVALVGTAGASIRGQPQFSLGDDGDPSFREIPAKSERVRLAHVGYDVPRARRDPDVVFPLGLLRELAGAGVFGDLSPRAFSFMGYMPETGPLLRRTAPAVARKLLGDAADLVLLVPA